MQAVRNKMATLKAKLAEAVKAADEAEAELQETNDKAAEMEDRVVNNNNKLAEIEDDLDMMESKLQLTNEKLREAQNQNDENDQAHKVISNRGMGTDTKKQRLQKELAELTETNDEALTKLEDVLAEVAEKEEILDGQEGLSEEYNESVKTLEVEAVQVGNSLRSMEINEKVAGDNTRTSAKLKEIMMKIEDKDNAATTFEERATTLEHDHESKWEELTEAKEEYNRTKEILESLIAEITEM